MAVTCFPTPYSIQMSTVIKPFSSVFKLKHTSQVTMLKRRTTTVSNIRSSLREEVFEDHCNGIICYKDARGETICEGYDEGPRYFPPNRRINRSRDAEIFDILQQNWCNFMTDTELYKTGKKGHYLQEGFNSNGFNTLF